MKGRKNKILILVKNYIFMILVFMILVFVSYKFIDFRNGSFYNLTQEKDEVESKKEIMESEIETISEKKQYLKTEDGKERVTREVNLYKKPGEKVINIIDF